MPKITQQEFIEKYRETLELVYKAGFDEALKEIKRFCDWFSHNYYSEKRTRQVFDDVFNKYEDKNERKT